MLIVSLGIHLSQGALAGACVMQLGLAPWPGGDDALVRPMAYAVLGVPMQRALHILGLFSFLGAADLHVGYPRLLTGCVLVMYALVVLTLVLELPTVLALRIRRDQVEEPLSTLLEESITNSSRGRVNFTGPPPFEPEALPLMRFDLPVNGTSRFGLFATALTLEQLRFWQGLLWVRAVLAFLCWVTTCLAQSTPAFGVPPLLVES